MQWTLTQSTAARHQKAQGSNPDPMTASVIPVGTIPHPPAGPYALGIFLIRWPPRNSPSPLASSSPQSLDRGEEEAKRFGGGAGRLRCRPRASGGEELLLCLFFIWAFSGAKGPPHRPRKIFEGRNHGLPDGLWFLQSPVDNWTKHHVTPTKNRQSTMRAIPTCGQNATRFVSPGSLEGKAGSGKRPGFALKGHSSDMAQGGNSSPPAGPSGGGEARFSLVLAQSRPALHPG